MPISTGQGTLNIGKDVKVDLVLSNGQHLILAAITSFDAKPKIVNLDSKGLDGINRHGKLPGGWSLRMEYDRSDRSVDDWWADLEAAYYAGVTINSATVMETIQEADGSISQWRYEGVALGLDDPGTWRSDQFVKGHLSGEASFRKRIQ